MLRRKWEFTELRPKYECCTLWGRYYNVKLFEGLWIRACPAGNFSHVTSFQRLYEVEITLRRRLTSIQRRIDVVFPTSSTSLQRRIDVMLETMLKSG